jgi:ribosome biogenesis protein MAK21
MHFLDKFVYRNAKKNIAAKGKSIMQPLGSRSDGGIMFTRGNGLKPGSTLLNSETFMNKKLENVSADEVIINATYIWL